MKSKIKKLFNFDYILDFLLFLILILQDIYKLTLFGTPFYKFIIILMLMVLLFDVIKNKKTIKINTIYVLLLFLIYIYTYVISFSKTIVVPSLFFIIESFTFLLYFQFKNSEKKLFSSIFNIILCSSLFISILGIFQFITFKLGYENLYSLITQFQFYLYEGRFSSIYSEPAHLCTIIGAGIFISLYNLINKKEYIDYLFLIVLLFMGIISGSVVTYISLFIFILLFIVYIFLNNKSKEKKLFYRIKYICSIMLIVSISTLLLFEHNILDSSINKIQELLSRESYRVSEKINNNNLQENKETINSQNENDNSNNSIVKSQDNELIENSQNENVTGINNIKEIQDNNKVNETIIYDQMANASSYALKSNLYIGIEKLKDNYLFGTGMFTHIDYYDYYMKVIYPDGYYRLNYSDACSMFLRIFSEFGIIGLIIYITFLIYLFVIGLKKKNIYLLFILMVYITQSMRLGEYNWILNCMSFIILLQYIEIPKKMIFELNPLIFRKNKKL